ncbi:hypothetical protein WJX79_002809 [Trebouxia sp. C0005]
MASIRGLCYCTSRGTFARPAPLLDCRTRGRHPSVHHQRSRLCARGAMEEQSSLPLRQQFTALFSAAALLAPGLSTAGPSFAQENDLIPELSQSITTKMPAGLLFKPLESDSNVRSEYKNFHQLKANDIDGKEVNFAEFDGKVVLVDFATLQQTFAGKDVVIVAFPCNQFLNQEPGSNDNIKQFAQNKGFKGFLMDKIDVNGSEASPVYTYLKEASGDASPIPWNFAKFLVKKDGTVFGRYGPKSSATEYSPLIEKLLADSK